MASRSIRSASRPAHRAVHPLAHELAAAYHPLGFLSAMPAELRRDPAFVWEAISELALASNTTELAKEVGMSRMGLRKALAPGANPTFTTVVRVADALGLRLELVVG